MSAGAVVKCVVGVAAVVVLASACSVSGEPERAADLSDRAVPSDAFPYGPGLPVQDPGIVSDLTFRPLTRANTPADCTPAPVDRASAQIRVGPGGPAGGTLTAMVVRADDGFDDFVAQASRCDRFALGGTVGTTVTTTVGADAPEGTARFERLIVMGPQGPDGAPPTSSVTEFVAQRGDVRVYVQNRRSGADALGIEEFNATKALFEAARASAFGA